ncbi:hypothetical protein ES705_15410 [subsurface metagenome]
MQAFRLQSGEALAVCYGLQLEQLPARLVLQKKIKHWSLRSLLVKLIKSGAKIVRHSRYIMFKMAEVTIDKRLFAEILSRIERLRCYSV